MRKKRRRIGVNLSVSVLIALILAVVCACKKEKTKSDLQYPFNGLYTYYKNFKIEGIRMYRVSIDGIPSKNYALYILETYTDACNSETRYRDPEILGGIIHPYDAGLNDTIYRLSFIHGHKRILPKPLRWSTIGEKVSCELYISKKVDKKNHYTAFYNGDYEHLPLDMSNPIKYKNISYRSVKSNKDTLRYLITFDKRQSLPDSVFIVFPVKDIKTAIDNSTIERYSLISHSDFMEPWDSMVKRASKIVEERNKREIQLRERVRQERENIK